jgi:hypothetical protein
MAAPNLEQAVAFFSVTNSRYFPGCVALLNSLRLTGHDHDLVFGDCGLTREQRALLDSESRLVHLDADGARDPVLLKCFPAELGFEGVVVIIDSDMIVTDSLNEVLTFAARGMICAVVDPEADRRFPEWETLFGLAQPPRHQEYVSSGFVAWSTVHWPQLLGRWRELCERVPAQATLAHGAANSEALSQGDQDALNALLMTEVPPEALHLLADEERPVWRNTRVRVLEESTLACEFDGHRTKLLHADGSSKPWQPRVWWRIRHDAYVRLLRRLLFANDAAVPLSRRDVPIWLRPGLVGTACLSGLDHINGMTSFLLRRRTARYLAMHGRGIRRRRDARAR